MKTNTDVTGLLFRERTQDVLDRRVRKEMEASVTGSSQSSPA
jgi:hypothetical protein